MLAPSLGNRLKFDIGWSPTKCFEVIANGVHFDQRKTECPVLTDFQQSFIRKIRQRNISFRKLISLSELKFIEFEFADNDHFD